MASPALHPPTRPRRQFGLPQQQQQQQPPSRSSSATLPSPSPRSTSPGTPTPSHSHGATPSPGPPGPPVPPKSTSPLARPTSAAPSSLSPAPVTASGPVVCPICNLTLPNLYLLNQHLDARHTEETDEFKTAVSNFFRNAQKVLNPIAKNATTTIKNIPANSSELLRRIQDLDLDSPDGSGSGSGPLLGTFAWTDPRADTMVTKRHWVKESLDREVCQRKNCDKILGIRYGRQHCRCCGQLFCDTHTLFQLKLDSNAQHDPSGLWCRVCKGCFLRTRMKEDSFNEGVIRSHTTDFKSLRAKNAEKIHLEVNRLEKRIEKLAAIHQKYDPTGSTLSSPDLSPTGTRSTSSTLRTGSLRISSSASSSPISGSSSVRAKGLLRSMTSIKGQTLKDPDKSEAVGHTRACTDCYNTVFKRREHAADQKKTNAVIKYYGSLMRLRDRIDVALPRFQDMITAIGQKPDMHKEHPDYQLAAKTRKDLLDDFALFDAISKKIHALPAHSVQQKQLQNNLHWWATQYLQTNMFPLSVIPKVFQNQGDGPGSSYGTGGSNGGNDGGSGKNNAKHDKDSSSLLPPSTSKPQQDEKISEAMALIAVLEEQRSQVESFIEDASRRRRFDDVTSLKQSLDELEAEILRQKQAAGLA
ncbi:carboxypeptidase Y-deficient [Actinomortierella wolfii]|nr:carboxypeptidase Y-deficient [Actinomortierella wolfii]